MDIPFGTGGLWWLGHRSPLLSKSRSTRKSAVRSYSRTSATGSKQSIGAHISNWNVLARSYLPGSLTSPKKADPSKVSLTIEPDGEGCIVTIVQEIGQSSDSNISRCRLTLQMLARMPPLPHTGFPTLGFVRWRCVTQFSKRSFINMRELVNHRSDLLVLATVAGHNQVEPLGG